MGNDRSEANIQNEILIALSEAGCIVWRQNTGAYKDKTGRVIRYGLCVGSSDIIGITPSGKFLAVEVKSAKGRTSKAQDNFLATVRRSGGRAGVARSVDDAMKIALDG